jgi:regulator of RNase E activity RraA
MIGSVEVRPGDLVLGDDDGLVVATVEEVLAVLDARKGSSDARRLCVR